MNAKRVLLVEDSEPDRYLAKRQLKKTKLVSAIVEKTDGLSALEYLKEIDRAEIPDLILLDINMPLMDGFEFLEAFNACCTEHSDFGHAQIFILTSSDNPKDRETAQKHVSVAGYLVKPVSLAQLKAIL